MADWLLIATLGGSGRFGHAGGELVTAPGDWVLIRPGTFHDYGVEASAGRWELLWVHFQPRAHWHAWLDWPSVAPGLGLLRVPAGPATDRFHEMHRLSTADLRRREAQAINRLEALLLDCDELNPRAAPMGLDGRVHRAMLHMERHLQQRMTLADIASAVGLSPSRFAHLFRDETGQTPQRHLESLRMRHAAELLQRTGFSVKQVADATGFDSPFYFSQRFKAWTGQSPSHFRAQVGRPKG